MLVKEAGFGQASPSRFLRLPTASNPSHVSPSSLISFLGFRSAMADREAAGGDDDDDVVLASFLESEILSGDQVLFFFAISRVLWWDELDPI